MSALPARDGLLLFARYAFMPNRLGFCGGPHERGLFEACVAGEASVELRTWAKLFEGAYPYLTLIANANAVRDPFDYRVVEAYWLGNALLARAALGPFYASLRARFGDRLSPRALELVLGQIPAGAEPFHGFHVLEICRRTGALAENLETLDNCRISWGRVVAVLPGSLTVTTQPLTFAGGHLTLGGELTRTVARHWDGHGFVEAACPGDWVSIHWGWACDQLTEAQVANLRWHTLHNLELTNQTL